MSSVALFFSFSLPLSLFFCNFGKGDSRYWKLKWNKKTEIWLQSALASELGAWASDFDSGGKGEGGSS